MSTSKDVQDYVRQLTDAETLSDLSNLMALYSDLAIDAGWAVAMMTEADFLEFRRGLKQERKGRFAGEQWARKYSAVLMPLPMLRIAEMAERYKVPFAVAWRRIKEVRPDLLNVERP